MFLFASIMAADTNSSDGSPMMILLLIYGFTPTDLSNSLAELQKQSTNLGTHKQRESYWQAYQDIQKSTNKHVDVDKDGGKLYGIAKYFRSTNLDTDDDDEKGRIEFEPLTKRQMALVGTPKLMMGRHIKLAVEEEEGSSTGKEFIMPWFGEEAESAYRDITSGEECISIDSDRGVFVSTKVKRKNCAGAPSSLKSIDAVLEYISKLEPDKPLQSIAWEGHQPPKVNSYNVILTGTWPTSVVQNLPDTIAHTNTTSMNEIYNLFDTRRNNHYISEAELLIDKMITENGKNKGSDSSASVFIGMKDLASARRNALLKKAYICSTKKKFIQLARSEGGFELVVVNSREGDQAGKFEEWGSVVFETFYKLDLSIYG